jgi:hypothetical protein
LIAKKQRLSEDLTEYIRHYLMRDGRNVKQSDIYLTLKESIEDKEEEEVVAYVQDIAACSRFYAKLLDPTEEQSPKVASRMHRLNRFEATTAYPFLLNVYQDYNMGRVSEEDFAAILDVLETFLIRRFICNVPTHGLNRTFAALYGQAKRAGTLLEGVKQLCGPNRYAAMPWFSPANELQPGCQRHTIWQRTTDRLRSM